MTNITEVELRIISEKAVSDNYLKWLLDPEVVKYTEQRWYKQSLESITSYVKAMHESDTDFLRGIFYEGAMVGTCKVGAVNWHHRTGQISFLLGEKNVWGRGIGSFVVGTLVRFAFGELNLKKLTAGVYESNISSQRVFEKNGFKIEGKLLSQIETDMGREAAILYGLEAHDGNR